MGDLTQAQAKETPRPDEESVLAEAQPLWTPRRMLSDLSPRPDGDRVKTRRPIYGNRV